MTNLFFQEITGFARIKKDTLVAPVVNAHQYLQDGVPFSVTSDSLGMFWIGVIVGVGLTFLILTYWAKKGWLFPKT